jgi:hypothetical protein
LLQHEYDHAFYRLAARVFVSRRPRRRNRTLGCTIEQPQ